MVCVYVVPRGVQGSVTEGAVCFSHQFSVWPESVSVIDVPFAPLTLLAVRAGVCARVLGASRVAVARMATRARAMGETHRGSERFIAGVPSAVSVVAGFC